MRKYVGVVLEQNGFFYFAPFSSPKKSDYFFDKDGKKSIRKSIVPIVRMTEYNKKTGKDELKGTIKLSNMIPVPRSDLVYYDIAGESDPSYQALLWKEYAFIRANRNKIMQFARVLYNSRTQNRSVWISWWKKGLSQRKLHRSLKNVWLTQKNEVDDETQA